MFITVGPYTKNEDDCKLGRIPDLLFSMKEREKKKKTEKIVESGWLYN